MYKVNFNNETKSLSDEKMSHIFQTSLSNFDIEQNSHDRKKAHRCRKQPMLDGAMTNGGRFPFRTSGQNEAPALVLSSA